MPERRPQRAAELDAEEWGLVQPRYFPSWAPIAVPWELVPNWAVGRASFSLALGAAYEELLALDDEGSVAVRRRQGSYYTPQPLVAALLDRVDGASNKLLDPACGAGAFLLAAAARFPESELYGIDVDPAAVELCRTAMWLASGIGPAHWNERIRCGSALAGEGRRWIERLAPFDLVLGNPPFENAINRDTPIQIDGPRIGGTADLAYEFLNLGCLLTRPGGLVAMVLPKSVLNASSMAAFRSHPPIGLRPNYIGLPSSPGLFRKAAVYVCLLVLGDADRCVVETQEGSIVADTASPNWWQAHRGNPADGSRVTLSEEFELGASMTAGDAYDAKRYLEDEEFGTSPKLVTTGLIEGGLCIWGLKTCRYLGSDWCFPRLRLGSCAPRSLKARAERAGRPKLIVGGLSRRIKCHFDQRGECIGAVSTYSIYDPHDDLGRLAKLQERLLSEDSNELFRNTLGANAMGGGSITMKKSFLRDLPLAGF